MLRSTGVVRRLDELGRVVIPSELRRTLGIAEKDGIEFFVDGDRIILRKYAPGCSHCGNLDVVASVGNIRLCAECAAQIKKAS